MEETYKYNVSSFVSFSVKDGEKYSGDSYSFGKNKVGEYVTISVSYTHLKELEL